MTYAVFMRRPVIFAPRLAVDWLKEIGRERNTEFKIDLRYIEGKWVGAGEPMMYISGSFFHLVDLETIFLQKLGPACVAAYNALTMCADLPKVAFLAMDARHCAGLEMAEMMAYAASVGSARAKRKVGAMGFVGNATEATAHFFGREHGLGTMPHALIGYAGSTVRAAEMYHETFPGEPMTVLVDYFGREVSDFARRLPALSRAAGDGTAGGSHRYAPAAASSRGSIRRPPMPCWSAICPSAIRGYRSEEELRYLVGTGVSPRRRSSTARRARRGGLQQGQDRRLVGLRPAKCRVMAEAKAPIDVVGTGSFLPSTGPRPTPPPISSNMTAKRVKVGREFLHRGRPERRGRAALERSSRRTQC